MPRNTQSDIRSLQRQTAYLTSHLDVVPSGNFAKTSLNYEVRSKPLPPRNPLTDNIQMSIAGLDLWQPNIPYGTPRNHLLIDPWQQWHNKVEALEWRNPLLTAPYFDQIPGDKNTIFYKQFRVPIPPAQVALGWTRAPYERPQVLPLPLHSQRLGPKQQWPYPGQGIQESNGRFFVNRTY